MSSLNSDLVRNLLKRGGTYQHESGWGEEWCFREREREREAWSR